VQRALDDLDRAVDAGAKAARLGEDDFFEHQRAAGRERSGRACCIRARRRASRRS
jgi:hypothetical protein